MAPGAHLLLSWISSVNIFTKRRERAIVTLSGIAPDIDGLGFIIDRLTGTTDYYFKFHHYLGHSILAALVFASLAALLATSQRVLVWVMSFILVHVHILCDLVGSKSPDGNHWPIYYLYPVNSDFSLSWKYQWELNAWPNQVIMVCLIGICLHYAGKKKVSFLEVFSQQLDREAFKMYNKYIRKNP